MTTLLCDELITELRQEIVPGRATQVVAFRPHLLKFGEPAGSLVVEFQDENGVVMAVSEPVAISDIDGDPHAQGVVRFLIECAVRAGTSFFAVLKGQGYVYGSSAYIAWCLEYENPRNPLLAGAGGQNRIPYGWELWSQRQEERGYRRG